MSEAALLTSNDVMQSVCPRSVEVSARRSRRSHIRQLWSDEPVIRRCGPPPFDITKIDDAWALCEWEWNGVNARRAACIGRSECGVDKRGMHIPCKFALGVQCISLSI